MSDFVDISLEKFSKSKMHFDSWEKKYFRIDLAYFFPLTCIVLIRVFSRPMILFWNGTVGGSLQFFINSQNETQVCTTKKKKTSRKERKQSEIQDYRGSSHSRIWSLTLSFTLWVHQCISALKRLRQFWISGGIFSKSHPFLHFQMAQLIKIIISREKAFGSCRLILLTALLGQFIRGGWTPIECQHAWAKWHLRNKW